METQKEQKEAQKEQMEVQKKQMDMQRLDFAKQMEALISRLGTGRPAPVAPAASVPSFASFESTLELWRHYLTRFHTFVGANSITRRKIAQVFMTNKTTTTYKLLCTLSGQQSPPRDINSLTMDDIANFMQTQLDSKRFIVQERFKYWSASDVERKPAETV